MKIILTIIVSIFFAISVSAQQSPESVVRDYVRLLNDWLASPYDIQKKEKVYAILQNGKEKCTMKDEIVEKYNSDAGASRCIYDVYLAILRNIDVKKVEIMGMKNTSNDFIKRATVILKISGGIDLTTVSDFWISAQSISYIVSNDEEIMKLRTQKKVIIDIDNVNPKQEQSTSQHISSSEEHYYVDLGLPSGTLWATCNIGAKKPWNYGDYFAWGETVSKMNYEMKTYKHTTHYKRTTITYLTKYCTQSDYGIIVDNITKLNYEDDAATIKWGKNWCMPTYEQIKELKDNCSWRLTTVEGVNGFEVKANNGNTLFIPLAGFREGKKKYQDDNSLGMFWSSSLYNNSSMYAWYLGLSFNNVDLYGAKRSSGRPIRPVRKYNN